MVDGGRCAARGDNNDSIHTMMHTKACKLHTIA